MRSNKTSGVRGVSKNKRNGKWVAYIGYKGKHKHLGYFEELSDAIKARKDAEKEIAERKREEAEFPQVVKFIEEVKAKNDGKYNPANFSNMRANSKSGVRGVTQDKRNGKWVAFISYAGITKRLGTFTEFDDAVKVRKKAEEKIIECFGEEAERKREEAKIASVEYNRKRQRNKKIKYRAIRDLSGLRFGKLTALYPTEKRYHSSVVWKCKCDCGNMVEVSSHLLRSSVTRSCGCWREQDLEGKKFGKLTVLEKTDKKDVSRCYIWRCRCDCGKEVLVPTNCLTSGNTRSCGCLQAQKIEKPKD